MRHLTLTVIFGLAAATGASATSVRLLNLEELIRIAGKVFVGKVREVRHGVEPRTQRPIWITTFDVIRPIKGVDTSEVVMRQVANDVPGVPTMLVGSPVFSNGGEFLIFLHGESILGLSSIVGVYQGRMPVVKLPDGSRGFLGNFDSRFLLKGMSGSPAGQRLMSVTNPVPGGRGTSVIEYESLLRVVTELSRAR